MMLGSTYEWIAAGRAALGIVGPGAAPCLPESDPGPARLLAAPSGLWASLLPGTFRSLALGKS